MPVKLFFCYARKDEELLKKLKEHLRPLEREGLIETWHDREIDAGLDWELEIKQHLNAADIVLLLISSSFMDSDYCYGIEMQHALERQARDEARVIPIILRPVVWQIERLRGLQVLPTDGKPVASRRDWDTEDDAFYDVARSLQKVIEGIKPRPVVAPPVVEKAARGVVPPQFMPPAPDRSVRTPVKSSLLAENAEKPPVVAPISSTAKPPAGKLPQPINKRRHISRKVLARNGSIIGAIVILIGAGTLVSLMLLRKGTTPHPTVVTLNPLTVSCLKEQWAFATRDEVSTEVTLANNVVYIGSNDYNVYAIDAVSGKQKWVFKTAGPIYSSAEVANNVVYVDSLDGYIHAIDATTGKQKWAFLTEGGDASPVIIDNVVYASGGNGVYAIDATSGKQKWLSPTGSINDAPVVVGDVLYVGTRDNNVYAIDLATGKQKWVFPTKGVVIFSPVVVGNVVYVGSDDHNVYAIDAISGKQKWSFAAKDRINSALVVANNIVYAGSFDYNLYAIGAASGKQLWVFSAEGWPSSPTIVNNIAYVASTVGSIYALSATTGKQKWVFDTISGDSSPTVVNNVVYAGSGSGVYAIDAATGQKKWDFFTKESVDASPVVVNNVLYFSSRDDNVYAFGLSASLNAIPNAGSSALCVL